LKKDFPLNVVTSIIFPSHTHTTTDKNNSPTNPKQRIHNALLLITGNTVHANTLLVKPTLGKTHNPYNHYIRRKREKELSIIFYIFCAQNKKHRENKKQKEETKKKGTRNINISTQQHST
jgi:hypothetical protein